MAEEKSIGKITHYFDKIGVAIIELTEPLKVGETLHFFGHDVDFNQKVESMQIEHQSVQEAAGDESVGLKVEQKVKEGTEVFRVTE